MNLQSHAVHIVAILLGIPGATNIFLLHYMLKCPEVKMYQILMEKHEFLVYNCHCSVRWTQKLACYTVGIDLVDVLYIKSLIIINCAHYIQIHIHECIFHLRPTMRTDRWINYRAR